VFSGRISEYLTILQNLCYNSSAISQFLGENNEQTMVSKFYNSHLRGVGYSVVDCDGAIVISLIHHIEKAKFNVEGGKPSI